MTYFIHIQTCKIEESAAEVQVIDHSFIPCCTSQSMNKDLSVSLVLLKYISLRNCTVVVNRFHHGIRSLRLDFQPLWEYGYPPPNWCGARNAGSQNGWKSSLKIAMNATGLLQIKKEPLSEPYRQFPYDRYDC